MACTCLQNPPQSLPRSLQEAPRSVPRASKIVLGASKVAKKNRQGSNIFKKKTLLDAAWPHFASLWLNLAVFGSPWGAPRPHFLPSGVPAWLSAHTLEHLFAGILAQYPACIIPSKNPAHLRSHRLRRNSPTMVRRSRVSVFNPPHPAFTQGAKRSK